MVVALERGALSNRNKITQQSIVLYVANREESVQSLFVVQARSQRALNGRTVPE